MKISKAALRTLTLSDRIFQKVSYQASICVDRIGEPKPMKYLKLLAILFGLALLILGYSACSTLLSSPSNLGFEARIDMLPKAKAPVSYPVNIHWNDYSVPFIEAASDQDAAFGLGVAHAHLRWGQLELFRRVCAGRISEMAGPLTNRLDLALRTLDLDKTASLTIKNMDPSAKKWSESFVEGINWYIENSEEEPIEFSILDLEREPWTLENVVCISRLAGTDLSWLSYFVFLGVEDNKERDRLWTEYLELADGDITSFFNSDTKLLSQLLGQNSKSGSNSIVIGGAKTETGSALVANDPHLGISSPNFWVLAGVKSPSYNVVGLMIPGVPFFAVGRNKDISWGGTNMRGISSFLFELDESEKGNLTEKKETIETRWWFDREETIRLSRLGPIISDLPFFKELNKTLAINWVGHKDDNDEIGAFLAANRASNFQEFRAAFHSYGVSAQNMLYGDKDGNIGLVLAYRRPNLKDPSYFKSLIKPANTYSETTSRSDQLPFSYNPKESFIASANNKPTNTAYPLAYSYAPPDRVERMKQLASSKPTLNIEDLKAMQLDVYSKSSFQVAQALANRLLSIKSLSEVSKQVAESIQAWDGHYRVNSRGAAAFEITLSKLLDKLIAPRYPQKKLRKALVRGNFWMKPFLQQLKKLPDDELHTLFEEESPKVASKLKSTPTWGDLHRAEIKHPLGSLPLVGKRFRYLDYPSPGGNNTLLKAGRKLSDKRKSVTFGAQSRHISDMSDPNENYFSLISGQDGWLRTESTEQLSKLWQAGEYLKLPLEVEAIEDYFPRKTTLNPRLNE